MKDPIATLNTVGEMTQDLIEDVARALESSGWSPGKDPIPSFPNDVYRKIRERISARERIHYDAGLKRGKATTDLTQRADMLAQKLNQSMGQ